MRFSWLSYSKIQDVAFYNFFLASSKALVGLDSQLLGSPVLKKCNNWKHLPNGKPSTFLFKYPISSKIKLQIPTKKIRVNVFVHIISNNLYEILYYIFKFFEGG